MKKLFTLCIFAFTLIIGTPLKFDNNTLEKVYEAYQEYTDKTNTLETTHNSGTDSYKKYQKAIQSNLLKKMKSALTPETYKRYLILTKQEDIE